MLVNGGSEPQTVALHLGGAGKIGAEAIIETLSGTNQAETNTLAEPRRIVPVKATPRGVGASFSHTVPPYAIQVLEISTE